jgi:hypothetical protein
MILAADRENRAKILGLAFNAGPKALLPLLAAALALLGALAFFAAPAQAQSIDAEDIQLQLDAAKKELDAARNEAEDLKVNLNNLLHEHTSLSEQHDRAKAANESLQQQLESLPDSIRDALRENGVDVNGLDEGAAPKGQPGNIRKILSEGMAYMPVSRWHLLPALVLMLLAAVFLVWAGTRLMRPAGKSSKTKANAYIGKARAPQRPLPENAGKPANDISRLAGQSNEISRNLKLVLNALGSERERAQDYANSLNLQAQKLEQAIGSTRQAQENSIAALSKELNAKIQGLSRAVADSLAQQGQELKQILLDQGASASAADWQAQTKALLADIKQKVDALYAPDVREIMAQLDKIKSQSASSLGGIRNDIEQMKVLLESRSPQAGAQRREQNDEILQTGEEMLMDILKSR